MLRQRPCDYHSQSQTISNGAGVIERLRLSDPVIAAISAVVMLAASIWFLALWLNHGAGDLVITTDPTQGQIAVAIRGEVATPGVYRLGADARVADLIAAAGGTTSEADLGSINLAQRLDDEAQITIPSVGSESDPTAVPVAAPTTAAMGIGSHLIDLNSATQAELESLPGIGPVLAERIISWRTTSGPFTSIEQLEDVEGISANLVTDLEPYITVQP